MSFGKSNYRVGGTRGGADHFKWEDVKNDKYRENYLGHSVQAPVGRWQQGKDVTWYAKAQKTSRQEDGLQTELALAKQRDEDLMNEALGIAPRRRPEPVEGLSASEMKTLLKRGEAERDNLDVERIEGIGAAPVEAAEFQKGSKRTLAERYKDQLASGKADMTYALPGTINEQTTEKEAKTARKKARKAEKEAKKLKKEEKKKRKKDKRALHKPPRDVNDEDDKKPHLPRHSMDGEGTRYRSRSRSPPSHSRRREVAVRRLHPVSRDRSSRDCSRPPAGRRRYRSSFRRAEQLDSRGRLRSPDSYRSLSRSPSFRRRSRSPSRSRRR